MENENTKITGTDSNSATVAGYSENCGRWTLQQACELIRKTADFSEMHGYVLAIYGSTVKNGNGRDLDIYAIPNLPDRDYFLLPQLLADFWGGEIWHGSEYKGLMKGYSIIIKLDNKLIDLHIRTDSNVSL